MRLVRGHLQAFVEIVQILSRHRDLTFEMAKRELSDRYAGQAFGKLWAVIHPIFLMGVFVFIFAVVFKMKIGGTRDMPLDYTVYLLSGLVSWLSFQAEDTSITLPVFPGMVDEQQRRVVDSICSMLA